MKKRTEKNREAFVSLKREMCLHGFLRLLKQKTIDGKYLIYAFSFSMNYFSALYKQVINWQTQSTRFQIRQTYFQMYRLFLAISYARLNPSS